MDTDVEQLGQIASAIMLAGVGLFVLLQALRSRRNNSAPADDRQVKAVPD